MEKETMKGILIDPKNKSITEVEHDDSLQDIYMHTDCDCITTVRIDGRDTIYVDDNGLFRNPQHFFTFRHYPSPLAGKGLVLGADQAGESISPEHTTIESLEADIRWITREGAITLAKRDDEVKLLLAKGNPNHFVTTAADIIEDAAYSEGSKQGE
jgi:hypothetical protein